MISGNKNSHELALNSQGLVINYGEGESYKMGQGKRVRKFKGYISPEHNVQFV